MTIAGFDIAAAGMRAWVWADSTVYSAEDDAPLGNEQKLYLNPLAGLLLVGAGRQRIIRAAAAALQDCGDFEDAIAALPGALRAEAAWLRRRFPIVERELAAAASGAAFSPLAITTTVALVGPSNRFAISSGATFDERDDFRPVTPVRRWLSPRIDPAPLADDLHSVVDLAFAQHRALAAALPTARLGALTIAEFGDGGIRLHPAIDLAGGRRWQHARDVHQALRARAQAPRRTG